MRALLHVWFICITFENFYICGQLLHFWLQQPNYPFYYFSSGSIKFFFRPHHPIQTTIAAFGWLYFCNRASVEVYQLFIKFSFVVRSTLLHTKCHFCLRRAKDCHILVYIYSFYVPKSNRLLHLIEYEDGHLLKHAEKTNLA